MGQRLLIVDSDRRFIKDHQVALETAFEVDCLYTGEGVVQRLETGQYAAVLLCVEVAENKGYAVCSAIRRTPHLAEVKIALISAKATEEEYSRHQSLRGRADLYLHKPIDSITLVAQLSPLVPLRPVDLENPLGDLSGADLGEEWLESLKAEMEVEDLAAPLPTPEPSPATEAFFPRLPIALPPVLTPPAPVAVPKDAGKIELLEARIQDLETKLQSQTDLLAARDQELQNLQSAQERATRNLDEAMRCQTELGDLQQKLTDTEEALVAQESRASRAESEASHLQEKLMDTERAQDEGKARLAALEAQLEGLTETKSAAEARCVELDSALSNLRAEASVQQAAAGQRVELETRIQELQTQLEAATREVQERTYEGDALKGDIAGLEGTLRGQRRELADQAGRLGSLTRECESMLAKVSEREARTQELETAHSELEASLQSARTEAGNLRLRIQEIESAVAEKDTRFETMCTEKDARFNEACAEKDALLETAQNDATHLRDAVNHLQTELAQREQELAQQAEQQAREQQEWTQTLEARNAEITRVTADLEAQRQRLLDTERSQRETEGHLNEKTARLDALGEAIAGLEAGIRHASDLTRPV